MNSKDKAATLQEHYRSSFPICTTLHWAVENKNNLWSTFGFRWQFDWCLLILTVSESVRARHCFVSDNYCLQLDWRHCCRCVTAYSYTSIGWFTPGLSFRNWEDRLTNKVRLLSNTMSCIMIINYNGPISFYHGMTIPCNGTQISFWHRNFDPKLLFFCSCIQQFNQRNKLYLH